MNIENLKTYFKEAGLSVESSSESEEIVKLPLLRRMVALFNASEVRSAISGMFTNADLLVGGTFSGMPVVGVVTVADGLSLEELQKIHENDDRQTKNLWRAFQDANYFSSWKDWALYYNNVVSALSGIFCLRYFVFEDHSNFEKYKGIIRKMKSRQISPVIGVYGFACDTTTGEVVAPRFTFWLGAGAFRPKNMFNFLKNNLK